MKVFPVAAAAGLMALPLVSTSALADNIVTYDISGVTFDDGGTVNGSFVYDFTLGTIDSFDVTTTDGSILMGQNYDGGVASQDDSGAPTQIAFGITSDFGHRLQFDLANPL